MAKQRELGAFFEVHTNGGSGFVATADILNSEELSGQVANHALAQLDDWLSRYGGVLLMIGERHESATNKAAIKLARAIEREAEKLGDQWPVDDLPDTDTE